MDILIESTRGFEKDIDKLTEEQKDILSGLTLPTLAFFGWTGLFYAVGNIR